MKILPTYPYKFSMIIISPILHAVIFTVGSWLIAIPVSFIYQTNPQAVLSDWDKVEPPHISSFLIQEAYAQEAFSTEDIARQLKSRHRRTREGAVADLARQGQNALA